MEHNRTVWMANIDNKMDEQIIRKIFKPLSKLFYITI